MIRKKLAFLCSRFGGGGAEKHLLRILNEADFSSYEIHLILTRDGGNYEGSLDARVNVHHLSKKIASSTLALILARIKLPLWIKKNQPDLLVSLMDRQNVLLSSSLSSKSKIPIVLCCQNMPSYGLSKNGVARFFQRKVLMSSYRRANKIICISKGVRKDVIAVAKAKLASTCVIYNAGYDSSIVELAKELASHSLSSGDETLLLACGRLTEQKGFDILLRAIAQLKNTNCKLQLLGTGPDEAKLKQLSERLKLTDRIDFLGFKANPYPYFMKANLFILSSRWEGFGNVITESMACGTPVIATRCPSGPDEIITHGENGYLVDVESPAAIAEAIDILLADQDLTSSMAEKGYERSKDFSPGRISKRYFDCFEKVIFTTR